MSGPFDARAFVANLPRRPGVYRMYGADDSILYVGKAQRLRDRVGSYFSPRNLAPKVAALLAQVRRVEVTVTASETDALLVEARLVKDTQPKFNVDLKDDKSFPYIHVTAHDFPRLAYYRGPRRQPGRLFGPYPSSVAARETLLLLQKLFRIRPCEDTFFANRSRPCLQYQIGRCSAPCVGLISAEDYRANVRRAELFLDGRSDALVDELAVAMEAASAALEFERAAQLRDQIASLRRMQARQYVDGDARQHGRAGLRHRPRRGLRAAAGLPRWQQPRHPHLLPAHQRCR